MKTLPLYVGLLFVMLTGFTACNNDVDGENIQYTPEQIAYFNKNIAYVWEKKAAKDENGNLLYKQVIVGSDTALYRITEKKGEYTSHPSLNSNVYLKELKGVLIDNTEFQKPLNATFQPRELIIGLREILLVLSPDETVETIIPASLGYYYRGHGPVPAGSTLIFTYTIDKIM